MMYKLLHIVDECTPFTDMTNGVYVTETMNMDNRSIFCIYVVCVMTKLRRGGSDYLSSQSLLWSTHACVNNDKEFILIDKYETHKYVYTSACDKKVNQGILPCY